MLDAAEADEQRVSEKRTEFDFELCQWSRYMSDEAVLQREEWVEGMLLQCAA